MQLQRRQWRFLRFLAMGTRTWTMASTPRLLTTILDNRRFTIVVNPTFANHPAKIVDVHVCCTDFGVTEMACDPPEAMDLLQSYLWPGNIRELRNVLERVCIETPGEVIGARAFSDWVRERQAFTPGDWSPETPQPIVSSPNPSNIPLLEATPGSHFKSEITGGGLRAIVETTLTASQAGTVTTIRWDGTGTNPITRLVLPFLKHRIARRCRENLDALRNLVESHL